MKPNKLLRGVLSGATVALLLGMTGANAQTCNITGQNIVLAFSIANGNGYRFKCDFGRRGFYVGPGRIGCKGRSMFPGSLGWVPIEFFHGKRLKNGWKISDARARGGPGTIEKFVERNTLSLIGHASYLRRYNYFISKIMLQHNTKSCSNLQAVLHDAFGA